MKLNVFLWAAASLALFLPRSSDCLPSTSPTGRPHLPLLPRPLLLRLGEEFSVRLGATAPDPLQEEEKGKRADEAPLSLDLTFHLLREVLEMARAERVAQQADTNRRMMDSYGK